MSNREVEQYDLCVLGCGPGGFAGAMRALDFGKRVCIVERGAIGGAGVMWGALASKTMWELARDFHIAAQVDRGYRASALNADYRAVRDTVVQAVKEKQYQMLSQIETFSPDRFDGPGSLTYRRGKAAFTGPDEILVARSGGETTRIRADHFLVATGSGPRNYPGIAADQKRVLNSDGILSLREFPHRLVIIGAGIIGCEYATIFSNFRQTKVHLVDHKDRVVPFEDEDVSASVAANLRTHGVEIYHSAQLRDIRHEDDHIDVVLDFEDGHTEILEADAALISIGRTPNTADLGLDKAGVRVGENGYISTDPDCMATGRVWAAGDVTNHPALVNLAEMESRHAVQKMFGFEPSPLTYSNMSTIMFFYPAVAAVGLNERMCRDRGIPHRVAWYSSALVSRAIAMRALGGFMKLIVTDEDDPRILGMRAAGPHVSSTIVSISLLMDRETRVRDVLKSVYPHPSMSEGIQECLRLFLDKSIYKPRAFPKHIRMWTWQP